jgi:hypothetical protein
MQPQLHGFAHPLNKEKSGESLTHYKVFYSHITNNEAQHAIDHRLSKKYTVRKFLSVN